MARPEQKSSAALERIMGTLLWGTCFNPRRVLRIAPLVRD
jgi:hypothetical protein